MMNSAKIRLSGFLAMGIDCCDSRRCTSQMRASNKAMDGRERYPGISSGELFQEV